jgi:hypothetical protein
MIRLLLDDTTAATTMTPRRGPTDPGTT